MWELVLIAPVSIVVTSALGLISGEPLMPLQKKKEEGHFFNSPNKKD
jgi:hypothetical protein